ncbi:hypothetical protein CEXT_341151, partial [Caerostris extrusa]
YWRHCCCRSTTSPERSEPSLALVLKKSVLGFDASIPELRSSPDEKSPGDGHLWTRRCCGIRVPYMLNQSTTSANGRYPNLKGRRQIQFVRNTQGQETLTGLDNYENDSVVEHAEVHQHQFYQ